MSPRRTSPLPAPPPSAAPFALVCLAAASALAALSAAAAEPLEPGPVTLEADRLSSRTDQLTEADGAVELRQQGLILRAEHLSYSPPSGRARATGKVIIERAGAVYRGSELDLRLADFSGWFVAPEFDFPLLGTRGQASRIDFSSRTRLEASDARYTSCPRDAGAEPDWQLEARSVTLDFDANEGIAKGGRLRFLGVPILALPRFSFPVTGARKSGWLPPTINLDSRSGLDLSMPYYWNIAPNFDATIAPRLISRRGAGADAEFRYLMPGFEGRTELTALPHDRLAGRSRYALGWQHLHQAGEGWVAADLLRVSDDDWWKDFPRGVDSLTPRMLASQLRAEHGYDAGALKLTGYAAVQDWQVLQDADAPITAPYTRRPQLGLRGSARGGPLQFGFRTELNRFERAHDGIGLAQPDGWRWHAAGTLAWPLQRGGLSLVPRLTLNAAHYRTDADMADGRRSASRLLPTMSLDSSLVFERDGLRMFGRDLRQTLTPRLLYVRTPYRRQDTLPNYDAFGRDFNFDSIYAPNAFAGVDRISDANQLTAGVTTRLIDADSGGELMRLGVVQRFLFSDQRVAPASDGSVDGEPLEQRLSDLLLTGATALVPGWALDASLQYSPDEGRLSRSAVGASWNPGPYQTLSARYRLTRDVSEQLELGWQWPLQKLASSGAGGCSGKLYGVGRMNYSLRDSRVTDSVLGLEYDAGCWIARVVSERLSTGRSEATTRLLLQLELVGFSRLGSNPLQVLKDNIPGYRLLREAPSADLSALPFPTP